MKHSLLFQVKSPLGPISFLGCEKGFHRVQFNNFEETNNRPLPNWALATQRYFDSILNGKSVHLGTFEIPLVIDHLTPFQEKVYLQLLQTRVGEKLSYKELGTLCRSSQSARAVGTCMSKNRFPLIIPCHRVLPQSGGIGNYSAANGSKTKQLLLDIESNFANSHRHTMALPYRVKFLTKSR